MSPEVEPWVNRWTFSSPPPPPSSPSSHHQLFVSIRYRKRQFSNCFDFPGNSSDSYLPSPPPPPPPPSAMGEAHAMHFCSSQNSKQGEGIKHVNSNREVALLTVFATEDIV